MYRANWAILPVLSVLVISQLCQAAKPDVPHKRLFYRVVSAQSNAPVLPKTESVWTQDGRAHTSNTGMADEGFTEYPFCYGKMDFTFVEAHAIYPRLISGAQADVTKVNTADMVIDHVYAPDGCVWGPSGRTFTQTFTATQDELVSITLMVASDPGIFRVALVEDGPQGKIIGPIKEFESGHSMTWGTARWHAGQAPLEPGKVYGLRMWREDGQPWTPYLNATGDTYDGGILYVNDVPMPASELAVWIVEQPQDLKRAIIENADEDGWVYGVDRVTFMPRTPNVRMITLTVSPIKPHCGYLIARVKNNDGEVIAGPKYGVSCKPHNGYHSAPFLFAEDELPVTPGQQYHIEAFAVPHVEHQKPDLPGDEDQVEERFDVHARVYGQTHPGEIPAIYNLSASFKTESKVQLDWEETIPADVEIHVTGPGSSGNKTYHVKRNESEILLERLWAGHAYKLQLTATGPTGLTWRTPIYRIHMPRENDNIKGVIQSPVLEFFLPLANLPDSTAQEYGPIRYEKEVDIANGSFENQLKGWQIEPEGSITAPDVGWTSKTVEHELGINTRWGDHLAGWTRQAGEQREQVFEKNMLYQHIPTTPGHAYMISAWLTTITGDGPRGDTRIRIFADPQGGTSLDGANVTQWYWTSGRWMRFQHEFVASKEESTIGFQFFRWRDLDQASAYVDQVVVYDLGPMDSPVQAPPAVKHRVPRLALTDGRVEASDKTETYLEIPPEYVITGLGARAHYDNVTTLWLKMQPLLPDGTLGKPVQLRSGWEPTVSLEAKVELPDGWVATGFGAGIAPEWDVKRLGVWGRKLGSKGLTGEEKVYRGGSDLESGFERAVRLDEGRVLTAAGLNCMLNDVNGIQGSSARLGLTATGQAMQANGK